MKHAHVANISIYLICIVFYYFTRDNFISKLIETTLLFSFIALVIFAIGKWKERKRSGLSKQPESQEPFNS
ncbi:MAG: hypothetical protein EA390_13835 [Balneolaceae bacterium]|nr:MAG: hypothetical protein EA390_13835 [Balneolaceae bacterium]